MIIKLQKENVNDLFHFLIKNENKFFIPHDINKETLYDNINSKDKYYIMLKENIIIGYGMLRGYDEGYDIPSLGIIIDKDYRGNGFSKIMMKFLEDETLKYGSNMIRLTVFKKNKKAISLYKNLGYIFQEYDDNSLLGIKKIK